MTDPDSGAVVGVDVAKRHLDVAWHGRAGVRRFANTPAGLAELVAALRPVPRLVVVEATGGYELALVRALQRGGVAVAVVNRARCAIWRGPAASSPRPMRSMPAPSRCLAR